MSVPDEPTSEDVRSGAPAQPERVGDPSTPPMGLVGYLRFIGGYYRENPGATAAMVVSTALYVAYFTAYPVLFQRILDGLTDGDPAGAFVLPITLLVVLFLCLAIASMSGALAITRLTTRIIERVRTQLLDNLHRRPYRADDRRSSGDVLTSFTLDLASTEDSLIFTLPYLLRAVFQVIAGIAVLSVLSWEMTAISLALLPLTFVPLRPLARRATEASATRKDADTALTHFVQEDVGMLDVITAFQLRSTASQRLVRLHDEVRPSYRRETFLTQVAGLTADVAMQGLVITLLIAGTLLVVVGNFSAGTFVAFIVRLGTVQFSVQSLVQNGSRLLRVTESGARLAALVGEGADEEPEDGGRQRHHITEASPSTIVLDDVSVGYRMDDGDARPVLRHVDLRIEGPALIGITGSSGSGKSTLLRLLMRQLTPSTGTIEVLGCDPALVAPKDYFQRVTFLGQSPKLFGLSIADNLRLAKPGATDDEVFDAASKADAHEMIEALPDGYETLLGDRGAGLSGGQLQRVALARALLRGAGILLLDEPSSALDADAIAEVMATIESLRTSHLVLLVSHRLTDHVPADRILVFEHGQLVDAGTHEELVARPGTYSTLWARQSAITLDGARNPLQPEYLRAVELFTPLSHDAMADIASAAHVQHVAPGGTVYRAGDPATAFYVVAEGRVEVRRASPPSQGRFIGIGGFFGETTLLERRAHDDTVVAVEPTALLCLPRRAFERVMAEDLAARERVMAAVRAHQQADERRR